MQNITAVNTFTDPVTVLADGDAVSAANSTPTAQALANRTLFSASSLRLTSVTSAAGTTTLTAASTRGQVLTGSTTQTFSLPDETTCAVGQVFEFFNQSTGLLTVKDSGGSTLTIVPSGGSAKLISISAGAPTGNWEPFSPYPGQLPGTTTNDSAGAGKVGELLTLSMNGTSITSSNTFQNVGAGFSLTPGAWRISASAEILFGGAGTVAALCMSNTSGTTGAEPIIIPDSGGQVLMNTTFSMTGQNVYVSLPTYTIKIAAAKTLYFAIAATWSTSTTTAYAFAQAERAR